MVNYVVNLLGIQIAVINLRKVPFSALSSKQECTAYHYLQA